MKEMNDLHAKNNQKSREMITAINEFFFLSIPLHSREKNLVSR